MYQIIQNLKKKSWVFCWIKKKKAMDKFIKVNKKSELENTG